MVKQKFKIMKLKIGHFILPNSPSASSFPFWEYAKWFRWTRFTPKFPRVLDIQTNSSCNARCTFCNVGREKNKIHGSMSDQQWENIIDEVFRHPEVMRIHPYLLNDPLTDKKMPSRLRYITQKKRENGNRGPKVHLITNAGLLNREMSTQLLESEGIDEFNISFNSIIPEVYEEAMPPLKFDKVMKNILDFKEKWDRYEGKKPSLNIWTVRTKQVEKNLQNEKNYWEKRGFKFKARKLDNRAAKDIELFTNDDTKFFNVTMCPIPFWRAWIMWNGDMVMCCVDIERTNLLGNCSQTSIQEVWGSEKYRKLRTQWKTKQLKGLICKNCKGT